MTLDDLTTPALLVDAAALEHNLATMSAARPGRGLRPHVKAHKCTALAALQAKAGHGAFTCATIREVEGMARRSSPSPATCCWPTRSWTPAGSQP